MQPNLQHANMLDMHAARTQACNLVRCRIKELSAARLFVLAAELAGAGSFLNYIRKRTNKDKW